MSTTLVPTEVPTPRYKRFTFGVITDDRATPLTHKVRSEYIEDAWLAYIGPTALLLARRMDQILASSTTQGVETKVWAQHMGVSGDELISALNRLERFGLGEWNGETNFLMRRHWPEVPLAIRTPKHRELLLSLSD